MTAVQTQQVISMDRVIDIKVNRLSSALYDLYTLSALSFRTGTQIYQKSLLSFLCISIHLNLSAY